MKKLNCPLTIRHCGTQHPFHSAPPLMGNMVFTLAGNSIFFLKIPYWMVEILGGDAMVQPKRSFISDTARKKDFFQQEK